MIEVNLSEGVDLKKIKINGTEVIIYSQLPDKTVPLADPANLDQFVGEIDWERFKGETPIKNAPLYQENERVFRFGPSDIDKMRFYLLLSILGLDDTMNPALKRNLIGNSIDYVVVYQKSKNPTVDRYLAQMRIIAPIALHTTFRAITMNQIKQFPFQQKTCTDLMLDFMEQEKKSWGVAPSNGEHRLEGLFGGDGDWKRESLRFNLMIEDDWGNVIRFWSDACLLRK